jgi:AcrR family transcriptional regulator
MALAESSDTAARILEAAFRRLASDGYARLSTREIAAEAGVNHALIHYYFGTKDKLLIAVLDWANQRLLDRQRHLYSRGGGFAEKWAQARAFYEQDIASGFVRVQMELWAASLSNPDLREKFIPRILAWRQIIEAAVCDAFAYYELDLPVSPEAIASAIVSFWFGMEWEMVLGMPESDAHHRSALDAMQRLLERLDTRAALNESLRTIGEDE